MSHTSISGGYLFDFYAVRISPASLKYRYCNEIFLQSKNFILNLGIITRQENVPHFNKW